MPGDRAQKRVWDEEASAWDKWEQEGGIPDPADLGGYKGKDIKYGSPRY